MYDAKTSVSCKARVCHNYAQVRGLTYEFVGVNLRISVIMQGILYVVFSSLKRRNSLKVLPPTENTRHTRNVLGKEVLNIPTTNQLSA